MKFILVFLLIFSIACSDVFRTAPPANVGSGIPIVYPTNNDQNSTTQDNSDSLSEFGDVRCHSSQANQFNQQVRNFLSTSFDPNRANYIIKCASNQQWKGGFFIRGKVYFGDQKFNNQSNSQNLTVLQNSYLEIHIVDVNNNPITGQGKPIKMNIDTYSSTIRGQNANLVFQDTKGKVFLNGSVGFDNENRSLFSGTFEFQNFQTWDGSSSGLSGTLGQFRISACRFFECADSVIPRN
ncbi:MAG: hypothetical protein OXC37_03555 [Bdellovibrionaceae bacterium]|nr:hypothetical protein [Pseudobdellovibrionaceae bacterium]